ncbi:hypothetical protein ACE6H2_004906 [Prunus campanulata]
MGDHTTTRNLQLHHNPVFDVSLNVQGGSKYIDDDGRPKRTGELQVKFCRSVQNVVLIGITIGYTIAAAISMVAIKRSNCYHKSGGKNPCHINNNPYMIAFGISEIVLSQIPNFDKLSWLSIVAAVMSFTYSGIGLALEIAEVAEDIRIPIPGFGAYNLNLFRLVWRTFYVIVTTLISMILPFFNDVVGFLGALGYWPLTVYFPVEMYIAQKKVPKWSTRWTCLQILSLSVLVIALAAAAGSVTGVVQDLKTYKPFKTSS